MYLGGADVTASVAAGANGVVGCGNAGTAEVAVFELLLLAVVDAGRVDESSAERR